MNEQLIICNTLVPTEESLRLKAELIAKHKDIDLDFPIKDKPEHFQLGKAYMMHLELHQNDPKLFLEIYKTGREWLDFMRGMPNGAGEADTILHTLTHQKVCQYDVYPHPFSSIDYDARRKDLNPDQNALFMLDRYYSDPYGLLLSCNVFYQDDAAYYDQRATKTTDVMKGLLDKYKIMDQLRMIERAANNTLVPADAFES